MLFKSFEDAASYLGNKDDKKFPLGSPRNTRVMRLNDHKIAVRYCWTNVVTYTPESITLNAGGYYTVTTKKRINDSVPVTVYQKNYDWLVSTNQGDVAFYSGLRVDYAGNLLVTTL